MRVRVAGGVLLMLSGFVAPAGVRAGSASGEPSDPKLSAALGVARQAAEGLGAELRALLVEELRTGGAQAAVVACSRSAQTTTVDYAKRSGVDIRRVSLRPRNAANAPDALERRVLDSFDRLPAARRSDSEHWEVVEEQGRRSFRYLRPLVANAMCLNCHGRREALADPVKASLARQYPNDAATGYAPGDVRGAISVRLPLPEQGAPR